MRHHRDDDWIKMGGTQEENNGNSSSGLYGVLQHIPCSNRAWWLLLEYTWLRCIWVDIKKVRSEAAAQGILNCLFLSSTSKCVLEKPREVLKQDQPNSTTHSIQRATAEATFKRPSQHPGTREQQITSPSPQTCPSDDSQTASIRQGLVSTKRQHVESKSHI